MGDPPLVLFLNAAIGVAVLLTLLAAWVLGMVWAYRDARARKAPAWAVVLLVGTPPIWPLGLLLWYVFRPPLPTYTQPRRNAVDELGYPTAS